MLAEVTYNIANSLLFVVPFAYLDKKHVHIFIDNKEINNYIWQTNTSILIEELSGKKLLIKRNTPLSDYSFRFIEATALTAEVLNIIYLQHLYVLEELNDLIAKTISNPELIGNLKLQIDKLKAQEKAVNDNIKKIKELIQNTNKNIADKIRDNNKIVSKVNDLLKKVSDTLKEIKKIHGDITSKNIYPLKIFNADSTKHIVIAPDEAISKNYNLTLPEDAPKDTEFLQYDASKSSFVWAKPTEEKKEFIELNSKSGHQVRIYPAANLQKDMKINLGDDVFKLCSSIDKTTENKLTVEINTNKKDISDLETSIINEVKELTGVDDGLRNDVDINTAAIIKLKQNKATIATQDEANNGNDDSKIVTPKKLKTITDNLIKDRTTLEASIRTKLTQLDGVDSDLRKDTDGNTSDIAQLKVKGAVVATETTAGVAEIATQNEANNGNDDSKIVTPKKLKGITDNLIKDRTTLEASIRTKLTQLDGVDSDLRKDTDGNTNDIAQLKATETADIKGVIDKITKLTATDTGGVATLTKAISDLAKKEKSDIAGIKTQQQTNTTAINDLKNKTVTLIDASESAKGVAEIATQDEANNGNDDSKIVTPKKLKVITDNLIKDRATLEASIRTKLTQLDGVDSDLRKDIDENTSDIAQSSRIFIHYPQDNFNMSVAISDVEDIDFTTRFKIYHVLTINNIKDTDWQGYNVLTDDNKYLIQVFCAINKGSYLYRKYDRTAKTGSWQTVQSVNTYENITTKSLTCNRYFDKTNNAVGLYLDVRNHSFVKLELSLETGKITYQLGTNLAKEASDKLPEFEFNSIMSITDLSLKTLLDIDNVTDNSIVFYNFLSSIGRLVYTTKNVGTVTNAAGFFGYGIKTDDNKTFLQVVAPKLDFDTAIKAIDLEIYTRKIDITTSNVGQWNIGGSDDTFVKLAGYDNTNNKKYIAQRYAKSKIDSLLTGSRITGSGEFGYSCSLNSSGDIVAIGTSNGDYCEIYQLKNGTWTIVGSRITGSGNFSEACSLNSSGDIVAIGAYTDNSCQIYQLKNGTWTIVGNRITGSGYFGYSCSLNSSGDIVAIGTAGGNYCEIYQLKNGTWTIVGNRITGSGYFGYSCSLNSSGDIVVIGAANDKYCEIYQLKNGTWTIVGSRMTSSGAFGRACSLNSSGDMVALGAYGGNYCEIYQLKNGTWTIVGNRITGSGAFGNSCSLNSSGDMVAIGAINGNFCEIYQLKNGTWTIVGSRMTGSGNFGYSCSLNSSGDIVAIGTSNGDYCEIYQLKQRLFAGYYVNTNTNIGFLETDIVTSAIKYKYKDLLWVNVKDDLADGTFYRMMQTTDRKIYIELAIDDQDKFKFYQANSGSGTQQTFGGGKSKVNTFYKIADKQFQLTRDRESKVYSRAKPAGGAWHLWTNIVGTRVHVAPKISITPPSPASDKYYITTNDSVHYYQYKLGALTDQLDNRTKTGKAQWSKWVSVFGVKPILKLANKDTSGDYIRFLERRIKKLEIRADSNYQQS